MNALEQNELNLELIEQIEKDSLLVPGINRINACRILRERFGLSMSQANEYTRPLGEYVGRKLGRL